MVSYFVDFLWPELNAIVYNKIPGAIMDNYEVEAVNIFKSHIPSGRIWPH